MAIKFLNNLDVQGTVDLNDNELLNIVIQKLATDPAVVEGQIYYNTSSDILKYATASAWVSLSSATGDMTAVLTNNGLAGGGSSGSVTIGLSSATINEIDANTAKLTFSSANNTKLSNIATNANNFTLGNASGSTLGGVKVGTNLSITAAGVLSATNTNRSDASVVGVFTAGENIAISSGGEITSTDTDTNTQLSTAAVRGKISASGNSQYNSSTGVITSTNTQYSVGDGGLSQNNFTNADHSKLDGISTSADVTSTATVVATLTGGTNVTIAANGTISATDTNTVYSVGNGGLTQQNFTTADHSKLDGITEGANNYSHPSNHAISVITGLQTALNAKAPLASPTLTGTPLAPTASAATNNTQIASTAFVKSAITTLIGGAPGSLDTLNE